MGSDWSIETDEEIHRAEISARTLMKLKRDAGAYLGEDITRSRPPTSMTQRQATKDAGQIVGLRSSTSFDRGCVTYGPIRAKLVFDLGGGTFDVSPAEIGEVWRSVTTTGGDDWGPGNTGQVQGTSGIDQTKDKMAMQRLREAAEKAKIELEFESTSSTYPTSPSTPTRTRCFRSSS